MQIKNRIKVLRKDYLKLTQNNFSKKINISRSNLANIESGLINITDRIITDICTAFSVNEQWLRTGEEKIFVENRETILSKVADLLKLDDTEQKFLNAYLSLNNTQRTNFKESWRQIVLAYNRQDEITNTISTRPSTSDDQLTRTEKEELMHQQLDKEEKGQILSVSTITNGLDGKSIS